MRRLTTILAADVVGYSRLMAADEAGTLASLKALRSELIKPKAEQYQGRTIKLMGDGSLMEFASVVDAVAFAVEIQCAMRERNAAHREDQRIIFRIGINIGDVIVEGDDIYGDGVNVAGRLESLAEPGGVCISRAVHAQVKGKLDLTFELVGEKQVKNIPEPVTVYHLQLDDKAAKLVTPLRWAAAGTRKRWWPLAAAAALVLVLVAGAAFWWLAGAHNVESAFVARSVLPLPDKPSIAVLPFDNMSGEPAQDYFSDGMTEDLITDLSTITGLFVIARNSSFSYKGREVKLAQVAEELGVRYLLQGSVRRAGDEVRINARLIDAATGGELWADRYDGRLDDVFGLQDQITQQIVAALSISLTGEERSRQAQRSTEVPEAYDAFLRGWDYYRRHTPRDFAKAISYFEQAVRFDSSYGRAYAALAIVYWKSVQQGYPWTRIVSPDASDFVSFSVARTKAEDYMERALNNPTPLAYQVSSAIRLSYRQFDEAVADARLAVDLDSNDPEGYVALAWALISDGSPEKALSAVESAMRLDPDHPQDYLYALGMAQLSLGDLENALLALQEAQNWSPKFRSVNVPLAATYALLDRDQEARVAFDRYWEEWTFSANTLNDILGWWPYRRERDVRRLGQGLIETGLGSQQILNDYIAQLRLGGTLE